MKKSTKKLLVVAIATALTAASAGSALALENQFSGAFTAFYDLSNYSGSGELAKSAPTENYFVQRMRLGYTAKADDHVKLVTKFEFDYKFWGNSSYTVGRNSGGALGADSVNMETKTVYLDLAYPNVHAKIGMMPNNDSFKGILFDGDMAGILLSHDYSNASVSAGFFRLGDRGPTLGKQNQDLFALDGQYTVNKNLKVGAAYYYVTDKRKHDATFQLIDPATDLTDPANIIGYTAGGSPIYDPTLFEVDEPAGQNQIKIHNFGVNAEGVVGPLTLNGFALFQHGDFSATQKAHGYALNVGAKMPVGGGTLRSELLYVSGGSNAFYVAAGDGGTEGGQFYNSEMVILGRDKWATTIDNAIIYDVNNGNQGVAMAAFGYDYNFSDKLTASANVGFAAVADKGNAGGSDYLGTEVNAEAYYKLSPNVTLGARAGYVFLGDYFASSNDNPYDLKIIANYSF